MPSSGLVTPGRHKTIRTSCVDATAPEIAGAGQKSVPIGLLLSAGLSVAAAAAKCFVTEKPRAVRINEFLVNRDSIFGECGWQLPAGLRRRGLSQAGRGRPEPVGLD